MRFAIVLSLSITVACSDSMSEHDVDAAMPTQPTPMAPSMARAAFHMTARVLGPVQSDDDADLRIELRESMGVSARLNFLRLTCINGVQREWGAGNIAAERGTNRIEGNSEVVLVRHYTCPSSGRPSRLEADLVDANGNHHTVIAAPFHPDWPGV